ncbi:hypothetical protein IV203_025639 [Nitzschia inconspicua]|uniref:Uncharacterized protein n=1 Tax=Nitzschia inconspicua TaxID=303405 RepID=A0A9K3LH90_9STRA|nr:hypothetical protein IV203_025639 [Nitzschia inconspicua]
MEEAELFVVPSSVDELLERVWEEVSVSLSLLQNEDHSSILGIIRELCDELMPCNTWQMYRGIVSAARIIIRGTIQSRQEGQRKERRKVSMAALMELKEGDIQLQAYMGNPSSNVNPFGHSRAKGTQKQLDLKPIPLDENERSDIRSCFMAEHLEDSEGPQTYQNESDIQHIVQILLKDAVAACNKLLEKYRPRVDADGEVLREESGYRILHCFKEKSLWTDRPDHSVVCDSRSGAPLLTVETKKPITQKIDGSQGRSLSTYAKTRGQGYDYLRLMQFMGHPHPIHVATTIEETYVAWLQDNHTMEKYSNTSSSDAAACWAAAAEKTFKKLDMAHLTQSPVGERPMEQPVTDAGARTRSRSLQSSAIFEERLDRNIFHSQTFGSHQLFHVFVDAILYGLLGAYSSPVLPTLMAGERVSGQVALKLTSNGFEWVALDATVTGPLPSPEERNFLKVLRDELSSPPLYAIGVVGVGSTSKVFRVITNEGYEGVAKIYIKKHQNKTKLSQSEFLEEAHRSINTELQTFHATYPELPVSKIKLHGHPSLLMPYFTSIEHPDRTWKEKVTDALRKLKDGSGQHLKYYDDDVRWRHIGLCRKSGQVQLFDFNEMEVIPSKDQIEDEVERQWTILAGRVRQGTDTAL